MMPPIPQDPAQRAERKENLLLASALLRGQVQQDLQVLGGHADRVARPVMVVKRWLSDPLVLAAVSSGTAFFAASRRGRALGLLRWAWLAWRAWQRR